MATISPNHQAVSLLATNASMRTLCRCRTPFAEGRTTGLLKELLVSNSTVLAMEVAEDAIPESESALAIAELFDETNAAAF